MDTEVEFRSNSFKPILSEEAQVNPECYGFELAWWLCQQLKQNELETTYPGFEDWGWFLEYIVDDNEYWLCCSNVIGSKDRWLIYLKRHSKGMFGRNLAPIEGAHSLLAALRTAIEGNDEISEVEWRTTAS